MHFRFSKINTPKNIFFVVLFAAIPSFIFLILLAGRPNLFYTLFSAQQSQSYVQFTYPQYREIKKDENFLIGHEYKKQSGSPQVIAAKTTYGNTVFNTRYQYSEKKELQHFVPDQYMIGSATNKSVAEEAMDLLDRCISLLNTNIATIETECDPLFSEDTIKNFQNKASIYKRKIDSFSDKTLDFTESRFLSNNVISIGTFTISQRECPGKAFFTLVYDTEGRNYRLYDMMNSLENSCYPEASFSLPIALTCDNCWLAPVGKKYYLPSTYSPKVVATNLTGGGLVTPETRGALTELFNLANSQGISINITSSYRSYSTQVKLFESYVVAEMKNGLSRDEAEKKANTYSSKAGFSEHQLGTTLDLRGVGVSAFLEKNAYKFGFVVSYPYNCQSVTGYIYEPWHVRYIGKDLALELYKRNYLSCKNGMHLGKFLEEKKKY